MSDNEDELVLEEMKRCGKQTLEDSDECVCCGILFMSLPEDMICHDCREKRN